MEQVVVEQVIVLKVDEPSEFDPVNGIWLEMPQASPFGAPSEVEHRVAEAIRKAKDVGCGSEELMQAITGWPSFCLLSDVRANLLRPFANLLRGRILEVGAQCGALTRYLGERRAEIVAIESDHLRASIAALRCRDLPNVAVVCSTLQHFRHRVAFDCVVIVDPPVPDKTTTSAARNGLQALLENCVRLLSDDGLVILAVGNALGLKYFAGAPRRSDASSIIDAGLAGIDRKGLEETLESAGLVSAEFLYPLPGHKLPRVILHPAAFQEYGSSIADLVAAMGPADDQGSGFTRMFSERTLWRLIVRNSLAESLANSFLVVASKGRVRHPLLDQNILSYSYSVGRRRCYQKQNLLVKSKSALTVQRKRLYKTPVHEGAEYGQVLENEQYVLGQTYANVLYRILDTPGWTFTDVFNWGRVYFDFLVARAYPEIEESVTDQRLTLPPHLVDCTPANIIQACDGSLSAFDCEWIARGPLPIEFVLFRGLLYALAGSISVARCGWVPTLVIRDIVRDLIRGLGFAFSHEDLQDCWDREDQLQRCIVGDHAQIDRAEWEVRSLSVRPDDLAVENAARAGEIERLTREVTTALDAAAASQVAGQSEAEKFSAQGAKLTAEMENLRLISLERERTIAVLKDTIAGRDAELGRLAESFRSISVEREQTVTVLKDVIAGRDAEVARLAETFRSISLEREQTVAVLKDVIAGRDAEVARLTESFRSISLEREQMTAVLRDAMAGRDAELARLAESLRLLSHDRERLTHAIEARDVEMKRASAMMDAFREIVIEQKSNIDRLQSELKDRCAEVGHFRVDFEEQRDAAATVQVQMEALNHELDALNQTLAEREDRLESLASTLEEFGDRIRQLSDELYETESSVTDREKKIHGLTEEALHLRRLILEKERLVSSAAGELDVRRHEIASLNRAVLELRNSLSWRFTAPVRSVISFTRSAKIRGPQWVTRIAYRLLVAFLCVTSRRSRMIRAIARSGIVDPEYYRRTYPDVALTGIPPLHHYLVKGAAEGRNPNGLFDATYYSKRVGSEDLVGLDLLYHYLGQGAWQNMNPSPDFDSSFYLARYADVKQAGINPLAHYVTSGAAEGRDPKPVSRASMVRSSTGTDPALLFDRLFYETRYPDVLSAGVDPLQHYLSVGAGEGRDPSPLFHTSFYLRKNPDVRRAKVNPLAHYLENGAYEGRDPNPLFDSSFYLEQNPDVAARSINPLVHYISVGADEGRDPNPLFSTVKYVEHHPEVAAAGINPLVYYLTSDGRPKDAPATETKKVDIPSPGKLVFSACRLASAPSSPERVRTSNRPVVLCITHAPVYPPRAGNDYRIFRMLCWLETRGYHVVLVVSPLPGEPVSAEQIQCLSGYLTDVVLCEPDGRVLCAGQNDASLVRELDGRSVQPVAPEILGEGHLTGKQLELVQIDRAFCHDTLIRLLLHLQAQFPRCALLVEYVFMTRFLPLVKDETLKIVDTIDVFSTKHKKVVQYGISDNLALTAEDERRRLMRADVILAIQSAEARELKEIIPEKPVITVGVDFDVEGSQYLSSGRKIFYVASDNAMNVRGLTDFVRYAWPLILRDVPDAELIVAGRVGNSLQTGDSHVRILGAVDEVQHLYRECRVAINPAVAGTGLKIKTVEALCHFRPIVTWPNGSDGMEPAMGRLCLNVSDWYEFYQRVVEVLVDSRPAWYTPSQVKSIIDHFSPENIYAPLCERLDDYFGRRLLRKSAASRA